MAARCPHCGAAVEGPEDSYCCSGCELAASIITGAGLEDYYARRTAYAPRPEPAGDGWAAVPVVAHEDGSCEARLVVDNIRCASCVWLIERVLERAPGVHEATVSYATGRVQLRWQADTTSLHDLAQTIAHLGYRPRVLGEESAPDRSLLIRLGVAAFAAMNLMLLAASIYSGWLSGMDAPFQALFRWLSLALATPVALWCASPFFQGAWNGLRHGVLHIDLPIALGIFVLYVHGFIATLLGRDAYFDSLGMLVALLLTGRFLEMRGGRRTVEAASALVANIPRMARRIVAGRVEAISVSELQPGDYIDIPAGEELPADGIVREGAGELRLAMLTGEAAPVAVACGDRVLAGTLLLSGAITVEVQAVGHRTVLHTMAAQLAEATAVRVRPSSADRIAPFFTAATLLIAALTFVGWLFARGMEPALLNTVAVLVVACPCALALAQPLAAAAGLTAAARRGLLLRSPDALLDMAQLDLAVFDKTGTISEGELVVTEADAATLRIAAALERQSTHPIARAVLRAAAERNIPLPAVQQATETPGVGVRGVVDDVVWLLRSAETPGCVELLRNGTERSGIIRLGDRLRTDVAKVTAGLRDMQLPVTLLTGDSEVVARAVAAEAGIPQFAARVLPQQKADWISSQQQRGLRVLFVGDGVNDGPALARADVGIAMSTGAASSVLVADGVISAQSLWPILAGRRAAVATRRAIRNSQRRTLGYNIIAVAAAAAGLINPLIAAVLMPLSSGMVIYGSARVEHHVRQAESA